MISVTTVAVEVQSRTFRQELEVAGNCANCHDWDGKGVQSPYADLRGSRTLNDLVATNLTAILLAGSNAPLPVEHAFMPPFARGHSGDELAAVANFVNGFSAMVRRRSPPPTSTRHARRCRRRAHIMSAIAASR
jgi:mono/diheme cytochrome c family protein